ncbi:MAG: ABC transporter substrate-binding protein [Deltaproteobacteria bacterium]|nr:ABC transporter substrate-binding protein [Deltaproteobacteria bacterium]
MLLSVLILGCTPNNPYRESERLKNIFYSSFDEPPKHLDPARSYSSNEYELLAQIYEPPLQYHYLERPYRLIPLSAGAVPEPVYLDRGGKKLPEDASPEKVYRAIYEIRIKKGVMYQDHPAFAKGPDGKPLYRGLTEKDLRRIDEIRDFPVTGTRELTADDFIYQIKRLADPQLNCPILPILEKYILGLKGYSALLHSDLEGIRKAGGADAPSDETSAPATLDYGRHGLPGVEKVDRYTFRVILERKYPQFSYWLAMPFFAPVPEEAVVFYNQSALRKKNITLDRFPVGTGPFRMDAYRPQMEIALVKNENFHGEAYPAEGEPGDREKGFLDDAGRGLPFVEKAVFKLEKEAIPRWNKFLQGYYDLSGITSDSFDQAVTLSSGGAEPTPTMKDKGITLITSVRPTTYYAGFNMLDDVVGGYAPQRQKLRQAISIALDSEEYIEIFNNGRGIPAMGPVPPGIFGHVAGKDGINPFVYDWDDAKGRPVRKPLEYAEKLLAEAGYPGGRGVKDGRPLVITFDNPWTGVDAAQMINWYAKRLKPLGIQLENRTTDYNRFQEKMLKGNFELFPWGWNADYPDPENFFFLLVGTNGKVKYQGENAANYSRPEFDRLFAVMENMDNTPQRLEIIKKMTRILEEDSPWVWGFHHVSFTLAHGWVHNLKPNPMVNNALKYVRIDPQKRAGLQRSWNRARLWPLAILAVVLIAGSVPAIILVRRRLGPGRG